MKKTIILLAILSSISSFSSKVLSSDRGIIDKWFVSKTIEEEVKNRFDYNNDIAVISDGKDTKENAYNDALNGLESAIYTYSYNLMSTYFDQANLSGPGFKENIFKKFASNIAKEIIENNEFTQEGAWEDRKNDKTYVLLKIKKDKITPVTKTKFKERLEIIIDHLTKLKEGI